MATVTEATLKQGAMELLHDAMHEGHYEQERIDTALEVLLALRDDPADVVAAAEAIREGQVPVVIVPAVRTVAGIDVSSANDATEAGPSPSSSGSVKTDFIPRMSDYEAQGDTAPDVSSAADAEQTEDRGGSSS